MNTTPLRVSFTCPCCNSRGFFSSKLNSFAQIEGSTTDCWNCDALLIVTLDGTVAPFHEWVYTGDQRWPKDGKETGFITELSSGK